MSIPWRGSQFDTKKLDDRLLDRIRDGLGSDQEAHLTLAVNHGPNKPIEERNRMMLYETSSLGFQRCIRGN